MSVSCFSLSSEPSARPCGFSAFKVSAVLKDPVLQQEYKKSNPSLQRALTAAGVDLEAQVGVLLKYGSNQLDEHHYHVLDSYNISCRSFRGPLDPSSEYVGMVLYSLDNETEWTANGVRVKSGYIYFREFSDIKDIQSSQGQVSCENLCYANKPSSCRSQISAVLTLPVTACHGQPLVPNACMISPLHHTRSTCFVSKGDPTAVCLATEVRVFAANSKVSVVMIQS